MSTGERTLNLKSPVHKQNFNMAKVIYYLIGQIQNH